jgi:hypothetical protein
MTQQWQPWPFTDERTVISNDSAASSPGTGESPVSSGDRDQILFEEVCRRELMGDLEA